MDHGDTEIFCSITFFILTNSACR